jgi:hypothetical protein
VPTLDTPWQDTVSGVRHDWRRRAAFLNGAFPFSVDYRICRQCRLGWLEEPHTLKTFRRCGLARAALAALRSEHTGLAWHTMGGHYRSSQEFWAAVGTNVAGGYQQRALCPHVTAG